MLSVKPKNQAETQNATDNKDMTTESSVLRSRACNDSWMQIGTNGERFQSVIFSQTCRRGGSNNQQHWSKIYEACTKNLIQKLTE